MDEGRVIRMSWNEWQAGRASKRAALALHGLAGESRRTSARPEARRQLQVLQERMPDVKVVGSERSRT